MMKRTLAVLGLAAVTAAISSSCTTAKDGDSPSLVKALKREDAFRLADAVIVKANVEKSDAHFNIHNAADDLAQVISNITGRTPAIYPLGKEPTDTGMPLIYLGDAPAARTAGLSPDDLRLCDWRVKTVPGAAFVYGRSGYAVCSAVFDLAEHALDYHVLFPDDGPDAFTPDAEAMVPVLDRMVKPAIYNRENYSARFNGNKYPTIMKFWSRYCRALSIEPAFSRIEAKYRISNQTKHCHSSFDYCPPEKYGAEHPEYYSMDRNGQRRFIRNSQCQLCYTNPDTYRIVLESLLGFIEADRAKNPDDPPIVYDFTQMDNSDFICLCPECKKVIAKYNRVEGGHKEGGDAGLVLEFVNRLARDVRVKYPDVQIRMFAYVSSERAPEKDKITIEPNVRIWWCNVYSKVDATIPLLTPAHFNEGNVTELKEWTDLTKNVEIWDYNYYGGAPIPVVDALHSNVQFYVSRGIDSIFMENEISLNGNWDELNRYVLAKSYIEPDLDLDHLVRTFCRGYGKAADGMYEAYSYMRGEVLSRPSRTKQEANANMRPWNLDPSVFEHFAELVEKAYAMEDNEKYRARMVPLLKNAWGILLKLYRKDPNAKARLERAKEQFRKWGLENGRIAFMEPKWREGQIKGVEEELDLLTLKFDDLPEELRDVPDSELVAVDCHWRGDGKRIDDPKSPRGKAQFVKTGPNVACGIYDRPSKKSYAQRIIKANEELCAEKYTWVKLKTFHLGLETIFWYPGSWSNDFNLKEFHILDDGMDVDPNWYELWVSARYEDDTFYIDRLALRRIAPTGK